jgi:hypoxanthine phosphoribosyltransferase
MAMLSVDHSSGEAEFADELLVKLAARSKGGQRILIVDDINDSGTTIDHLRSAILGHGGTADEVRVAVLINNIRSRARVDYAASEIDRERDKRWFVFPWEAVAPRETLKEEAEEVPERLA